MTRLNEVNDYIPLSGAGGEMKYEVARNGDSAGLVERCRSHLQDFMLRHVVKQSVGGEHHYVARTDRNSNLSCVLGGKGGGG